MSRTLGFAALLCASAQAAPEPGEPLPPLEITDKGELHLADGRLVLLPWSTDGLRGQWTLLQYLAARTEASQLNRPAIDAVAEAVRSGGHRPYRLINIVNVSDVFLGATSIAMGILESNKRRYPDAPMIADMDGGRAHWGLAPRGSAIFLLDPDLVVRFSKDGALDDGDIARILDLLRLPQQAGDCVAETATC